MIKTLELIKKGMGFGFDVVIAPGSDQTNLGLNLKYTNDAELMSLKTIGELISSLELKIDGKVSTGAMEAFPMLAMILAPQVQEGGMLKADADGNLVMSASLSESALEVNGEPSPMQMMIQMMGEQPLDWDAIKESIANPKKPGQQEI